MPNRALLVITLAVLAACAGPARPNDLSQNRTSLTTEEMEKAGYPDVFTTVQSLRPHWLQRHGLTSLRNATTVKVYMDGSLLGGPEMLRQITVRSIASIRYYSSMEASQRWGLDHDQGAIVVATRR